MVPVHGAVTPNESAPVSPGNPPSLDEGREDARACRRIATRHARTFSIASWLLPARKRRAAFAIYATCRTADDIVDASGLRPEDGARALDRFRTATFRAFDQRADEPILRELARACREFDVPVAALNELFEGVARDLVDAEYETWSDLELYCHGVAGSVGEMCCAVFEVGSGMNRHDPTAVACARTLGVAMQLNKILRDVGEDALRGRCYLPTSELARFGLDRAHVLSRTVNLDREAWRQFMSFQVARARELYREALPGIRLLMPDSQRCAAACAMGYARILDAIEQADFDTLSRRVSASPMTRLGVAWRAWRGAWPAFDEVPLKAPARQAAP